MQTLKVLSALLTYPTAELQDAVPDIETVIENDLLLPRAVRQQLDVLLEELATLDLLDLQERYVLLFDRTRSLSLHLFEHVHGESRDRGQAMIDLKNMYEQNGLFMNQAELPDFLPMFLEFLATRPPVEAAHLLGQPAHILAALAERLAQRRGGDKGSRDDQAQTEEQGDLAGLDDLIQRVRHHPLVDAPAGLDRGHNVAQPRVGQD